MNLKKGGLEDSTKVKLTLAEEEKEKRRLGIDLKACMADIEKARERKKAGDPSANKDLEELENHKDQIDEEILR